MGPLVIQKDDKAHFVLELCSGGVGRELWWGADDVS